MPFNLGAIFRSPATAALLRATPGILAQGQSGKLQGQLFQQRERQREEDEAFRRQMQIFSLANMAADNARADEQLKQTGTYQQILAQERADRLKAEENTREAGRQAADQGRLTEAMQNGKWESAEPEQAISGAAGALQAVTGTPGVSAAVGGGVRQADEAPWKSPIKGVMGAPTVSGQPQYQTIGGKLLVHRPQAIENKEFSGEFLKALRTHQLEAQYRAPPTDQTVVTQDKEGNVVLVDKTKRTVEPLGFQRQTTGTQASAVEEQKAGFVSTMADADQQMQVLETKHGEALAPGFAQLALRKMAGSSAQTAAVNADIQKYQALRRQFATAAMRLENIRTGNIHQVDEYADIHSVHTGVKAATIPQLQENRRQVITSGRIMAGRARQQPPSGQPFDFSKLPGFQPKPPPP